MRIVILGAGVSGLCAGWKLSQKGHEVTVVEKNGHVGGLASSFRYRNYAVDYGPHKIYTQMTDVLDSMKELLGDDLLAHPKKSKVRLRGANLDYPIQVGQVLTKLSPLVTLPIGVSFLASTVFKGPDRTYEEYIVNRFGRATYELVFKELAEKVWGDPKTLDADLAKARLSAPSMVELLKRSLLGDKGQKEIHAKTFFYPRKGEQQLSDRMVEEIQKNGGRVLTKTQPESFRIENARIKEVKLNNGALAADFVVSTLPIEQLPKIAGSASEAQRAASNLKYRALVLLFILVKRPRMFEESFIFYPEKEYLFNRLSEQKAFSEETVPDKDRTLLCAEITCESDDPLFSLSDADVFERAFLGLKKACGLRREEVEEIFTKRHPSVYPVYSVGYKKNLETVLDALDPVENLLTIGRRGLFNYNNVDHCFDMAFKAADHIHMGGTLSQWKEKREAFSKYVIID